MAARGDKVPLNVGGEMGSTSRTLLVKTPISTNNATPVGNKFKKNLLLY